MLNLLQEPLPLSVYCEFEFSPVLSGDAYFRNQTTQAKSPTHWKSVKIALINSIRKGVFFDRKYLARHSNAGSVLKPIYFSSTIMNDKAQQLKKCMPEFVSCNIHVLSVFSGKISRPKSFYGLS